MTNHPLPPTIWITGLSASGKSTLGRNLLAELEKAGITNVALLDGEELRAKLQLNHGYTPEERFAVIKNIVEIAKEENSKAKIAIVSTISHKREMREFARANIENFFEVFLECPVEVCSERDYKGHYEKAFRGEYDCFVGVTEPYEKSVSPELTINTALLSPIDAAKFAVECLREAFLLNKEPENTPAEPVPAIVIAAGRGSRMGSATDNIPKCLLQLQGKALIEHQIAAYHANNIHDITAIVGYQREKVEENPALSEHLRFVRNENFLQNNILGSLMCAWPVMADGFIASYSDIFIQKEAVQTLLGAPGDITIVVDKNWLSKYENRTAHPPSEAEKAVVDATGRVSKIGKSLDAADTACAEFIGMFKCTAVGAKILLEYYLRAKAESGSGPFMRAASFEKAYITDLLQYLIDQGVEVRAVSIDSDWCEIDTQEDLMRAATFLKKRVEGERNEH